MAKKPPTRPSKTKAVSTPPGVDGFDYGATAVPQRPDREKKPTEDEIAQGKAVKKLEARLLRMKKVYEKWSDRFETQHLDDYLEGKQWRGVADDLAAKKYCINLIFATMETQLPSLLFQKPKVSVEARPAHGQTATSGAAERASIIEQTLQTFIDDPKVHFTFETGMALRDAFPRFGVVEVGYSADWIQNPNVGKPVLNDKDEALLDSDKQPILQPAQVVSPGTETLYVKRIPAWTYRVSPGNNNLTSNDLIAYYEWQHVDDVKQNPRYANHAEGLQATGSLEPDKDEADDDNAPDLERRRVGMVKVWQIWDTRKKAHIVHAEGHQRILLDEPCQTVPHAVIKFFERKDGFYPQPPIYNWLSPQDEINETREMQKVHRRRATRRFMRTPQVKKEEFDKLEGNEDMMCIEVPQTEPPPIRAIEDAPLHGSIFGDLAETRSDFNQITGVSGEARNTPDAPTATQANIINERATARESKARSQVAEWLAQVARLMLIVIKERMQLPMMVKRNVDPFAMLADQEQAMRSGQRWMEVKAQDLADLDVDVKIDVASLSPVAEQEARERWNIVLTLLSNPPLLALLMAPNPKAPDDPSPLLRKTLELNGIKSDPEVREVWRVLQAIKAEAVAGAQAAAAQAKAPEPPKVSITLKGEDLSNPLVQLLLATQGVTINLASAQVQPSNPLMAGSSGEGLTMPSPNGQATGLPSNVPTGM